jgi:hypothetical protein
MTFSTKRCGRLPLLVAVCALLLGASSAIAATVQIDLDRNTAGIQAALNASGSPIDVVGAVVVTGAEADTVASNVTTLLVTDSGGGAAIDTANSTAVAGDVPAGGFGFSATFLDNSLTCTNVGPPATTLGSDLQASIIHFNIRLVSPADGETFTFAFDSSLNNEALGVTVSGTNFDYPPANFNDPISTAGATLTIGGAVGPTPTVTEVVPTPTFTEVEPTPTFTEIGPTPTDTEVPVACADAGLYVLTSFGNHIRVGNPEVVTGNVSSGEAVFVDMEVVQSTPASGSLPVVDLAVLKQTGEVTFVENPLSTPDQQFVFDGTIPPGYAVDIEVSSDSNAFWVLTESGGIYRAGDANAAGTPAGAQLGNDAATLEGMLPIPFGAMRRNDPNIVKPGDNATIRAVAFAVVERQVAEAKAVDNANPLGFIVMDSQGGTYLFDGTGVSIRMGGEIGSAPNHMGILDTNTIYPFFPGLDIARDLELHPLGTPTAGLVIYDGWGGIHAVPNDIESPVRFLRNETAINTGNLITTVGMPYLIMAFDDATTPGVNEGVASLDVNSIFKDIEFCQDGQTEGAYTMDKFGGIFAFGSTRATPDNTAPRFSGVPYFYPFFYAEDMEPVLPGAVVTAPGK